jgi:hypothetical protein
MVTQTPEKAPEKQYRQNLNPAVLVGAGVVVIGAAYLLFKGSAKNPFGTWVIVPNANASVTVTHSTALPPGGVWVPVADFSCSVTHSTALPPGGVWVPVADFSCSVTHSVALPPGGVWTPVGNAAHLSVALQVALNPVIGLTSASLKPGDALWYTLSGFPPNAQVTMNVGQYSIVVSTDGNGYAASNNFPPVTSMPAGSYQLIAKYGNNQTVSEPFTISSVAQTIALNIGSDQNGFVDVIDLATGVDITQSGVAIIGHAIQITAYAWNSNYQFAGWTDNYGILGPVNKMYPQVSITATSSGINLYANFVYVAPPPPPPPPGGIFPAPGTKGDGQYWMYITFLPAYGGGGVWIGYNSYLDEYDPQDSSSDYYELASVQGPYASGATS